MTVQTARSPAASLHLVPLTVLLCLVAALALLWAPRAEATSPGANGKIAYVGDSDTDRGISLMRPDGSDKTVLVANSPSPVAPSYFAPVWSPDGRRIGFNGTTRYGDIWLEVMNADGSGVHRVGSGEIPEEDQWPDWSPDSEMIAFASLEGNIWVVNGDGGAATKLSGPARNDQPSWSPDGQRIAFTSSRDGNYEIYVMNADGSGEIRLTDDPEEDSGPVWSPDLQRIAFTSSRDGNYEIYGMNADGSDETRLTENSVDDGGPVWSPDGRRIAFTADATNVSGAVHVMNSDGSAMADLTASFENAWDPGWSPDGRQIAFTGERAGVSDVYVMNRDGSCQTELAAGSQPDWQSLAGAGLPPPSCETAAPSQTVAASQTPPPSNEFGFGKLRRNKHRGTARLTVRVPGPGELALRGKKLKRASKEPAAGGAVRLAVKPRGKMKRRLSRRRLEKSDKAVLKLSARARVTFTPDGGTPNTRTKKLRLVRHR